MTDPDDTDDHNFTPDDVNTLLGRVEPPPPGSGGFDPSWLYTPDPSEIRACVACGLVVVNGAEELHGHLHDLLDWAFAHRAEERS